MTDNLNLIVTVTDPVTGESETREIPPHDYLVITTGECTYSVQTYPTTGTHQVTIRGRRPG